MGKLKQYAKVLAANTMTTYAINSTGFKTAFKIGWDDTVDTVKQFNYTSFDSYKGLKSLISVDQSLEGIFFDKKYIGYPDVIGAGIIKGGVNIGVHELTAHVTSSKFVTFVADVLGGAATSALAEVALSSVNNLKTDNMIPFVAGIGVIDGIVNYCMLQDFDNQATQELDIGITDQQM